MARVPEIKRTELLPGPSSPFPRAFFGHRSGQNGGNAFRLVETLALTLTLTLNWTLTFDFDFDFNFDFDFDCALLSTLSMCPRSPNTRVADTLNVTSG